MDDVLYKTLPLRITVSPVFRLTVEVDNWISTSYIPWAGSGYFEPSPYAHIDLGSKVSFLGLVNDLWTNAGDIHYDDLVVDKYHPQVTSMDPTITIQLILSSTTFLPEE